jgi:hypothetical protein
VVISGFLALTGWGIITAKTSVAAESTSAAATQADYEKALADAKAAQKKAAAVDGEWRDLGKLIKDAEAAAAKGDYAKAVKDLATAKFQGEAGYAQAISQKSAGNPPYLK